MALSVPCPYPVEAKLPSAKAALKLYEQGLITYHRTDSVALSSKFLGMAKDYILKNEIKLIENL